MGCGRLGMYCIVLYCDASCRNGAEIHSTEFLDSRGKKNWFSKEGRPLNPSKSEDKHILQETGRVEKPPTSNDLFSLLGNIKDSCMARKARSPCEGLVVGTNTRMEGNFALQHARHLLIFPFFKGEETLLHFYRFIF